MNEQPLPTNGAGTGEVPRGSRPEVTPMPAAGSEVVPKPEVAPAPGVSPAPAAGAAGGQTPPPKLTRDDVAAAIAAVPGGAPPAAASGGLPLPTEAADTDVIEAEWVNKAEEQVQKHAGDPYGEEEAIQELQEDYLQKRYGISVGDPNKQDDAAGGAAGKPEGA